MTLPARSRQARYAPFAAIAAAILLAVAALVYWVWPGRTIPTASGVTRIAVLPVVDGSGTPATAAQADTLTAELISTLGRISSLQVAPLTSVLPYKGSTQSASDISGRLGVDALVQGSVVSDNTGAGGDGAVRAQIRVVGAGESGVLLDRPFTWAGGDIERLRSEIAHAVADAIHVRLSPDEADRFRRVHQTTPSAEEAYIRGRIQLTALRTGARAAGSRRVSTRDQPRRQLRRRPRGSGARLHQPGTAWRDVESRCQGLSDASDPQSAGPRRWSGRRACDPGRDLLQI